MGEHYGRKGCRKCSQSWLPFSRTRTISDSYNFPSIGSLLVSMKLYHGGFLVGMSKNFKHFICERLFVTLAKKYVYFGESKVITNKILWTSTLFQWLFCSYWNQARNIFLVPLFGARFMTLFVLESIAVTQSCNLTIYEYPPKNYK